MMDVGLDYLTLGQPTSTLSGGEIQRIKLSAHLGSRGRLYIIDEPSTGLHAKNIELLLTLLRRLVSEDNTVVIVEHRLELIAQADWIIDMGPDSGTSGGEVVFSGTPQEKTSLIITTNKAPTEWAKTLDDEVLATAILDRLLYRCEVIKLSGKSYRMGNRKTIFGNENEASDNENENFCDAGACPSITKENK